jgi:hypothetical protein
LTRSRRYEFIRWNALEGKSWTVPASAINGLYEARVSQNYAALSMLLRYCGWKTFLQKPTEVVKQQQRVRQVQRQYRVPMWTEYEWTPTKGFHFEYKNLLSGKHSVWLFPNRSFLGESGHYDYLRQVGFVTTREARREAAQLRKIQPVTVYHLVSPVIYGQGGEGVANRAPLHPSAWVTTSRAAAEIAAERFGLVVSMKEVPFSTLYWDSVDLLNFRYIPQSWSIADFDAMEEEEWMHPDGTGNWEHSVERRFPLRNRWAPLHQWRPTQDGIHFSRGGGNPAVPLTQEEFLRQFSEASFSVYRVLRDLEDTALRAAWGERIVEMRDAGLIEAGHPLPHIDDSDSWQGDAELAYLGGLKQSLRFLVGDDGAGGEIGVYQASVGDGGNDAASNEEEIRRWRWVRGNIAMRESLGVSPLEYVDDAVTMVWALLEGKSISEIMAAGDGAAENRARAFGGDDASAIQYSRSETPADTVQRLQDLLYFAQQDRERIDAYLDALADAHVARDFLMNAALDFLAVANTKQIEKILRLLQKNYFMGLDVLSRVKALPPEQRLSVVSEMLRISDGFGSLFRVYISQNEATTPTLALWILENVNFEDSIDTFDMVDTILSSYSKKKKQVPRKTFAFLWEKIRGSEHIGHFTMRRSLCSMLTLSDALFVINDMLSDEFVSKSSMNGAELASKFFVSYSDANYFEETFPDEWAFAGYRAFSSVGWRSNYSLSDVDFW